MTSGIGVDKASEYTPKDFERLLLRTSTLPSFHVESKRASPFGIRICTRICIVWPGDAKRNRGPAADVVMTAAA
jgi:hypothetical protein